MRCSCAMCHEPSVCWLAALPERELGINLQQPRLESVETGRTLATKPTIDSKLKARVQRRTDSSVVLLVILHLRVRKVDRHVQNCLDSLTMLVPVALCLTVQNTATLRAPSASTGDGTRATLSPSVSTRSKVQWAVQVLQSQVVRREYSPEPKVGKECVAHERKGIQRIGAPERTACKWSRRQVSHQTTVRHICL